MEEEEEHPLRKMLNCLNYVFLEGTSAHLLSWQGVWMHAKHKYKSGQIQTQLAGPCSPVIRERARVVGQGDSWTWVPGGAAVTRGSEVGEGETTVRY